MSSLIAKHMPSTCKQELKILFARAMQKTTITFSFFDKPVWHNVYSI